MTEIFTGQLTCKEEKKNRRWFLAYTSKKGKPMNEPISPDKFAPSLRDNQASEIEVSFELDQSGRPLRVRPVGEDWQESTSAVQAVPAANAPQNQGDYRRGENRPRPSNAQARENMTNASQDLPREFHNPYNFVPALPRQDITNELGDREPSGHDRYIADLYSGKLRVKMRVETPLLILDTARMNYNKDNEHKSYPVRVDADGNPFIHPTSIKGMLRSAYEVITNSRLSIFKDHDERLAYRAEVGEGLFVVPARIENEKVFLYPGTSALQDNGKPQNGEPMYAAWVRKYQWHGKYASGSLNATHKQRVWAYITLWRHRRFNFWNVAEIRPYSATPPTSTPTETRVTVQDYRDREGRTKTNRWNGVSSSGGTGQWVEGYYCQTNHNIKNKHDERIFFVPQGQTPIEAEVKDFEQLRKEWKRLVENYQEEHSDGKGGLQSPPKDVPEWSRQIKGRKNEAKLETETLCYAKVRRQSSGTFEVLELYPVMISRRLHDVPPAKLLHDSLKPAKHIAQLSPADRVFGWVGDGVKKNGNYRGQVRLSSVNCIGLLEVDENGNQSLNPNRKAIQDFNDLPLNILGQPKPQQGRFYVAETSNAEAQNNSEKRNNETAGYKVARGLRGRKIYPHHANLPTDYWFEEILKKEEVEFQDASVDKTQKAVIEAKPGFFREYLRPKSKENKQQRDSQNRSIQGWVKKGTEFEFDIHFTNLSKVELGALVWLLSLEADYFHRFGGGKPLGFGSVSLGLAESEITSGSDLKGFYQSLDVSLNQSITATECKTAFESAYQTAGYQRIIDAFLRAGRGFVDTQLPTHYPRARQYKETKSQFGHKWKTTGVVFEQNQTEGEHPPPHKDGLAYEWFVENAKEKIEVKGVDGSERDKTIEVYAGKPVIRPRFVLDDLAGDKGLPILPHKVG